MNTAYISFFSLSSGLLKMCAHDTTYCPSSTAKPVPCRLAGGRPVGMKVPTPTTPGLMRGSMSATSAWAGAATRSATTAQLVRRLLAHEAPNCSMEPGKALQIRYNPGGSKNFLFIRESKHERCGGCRTGVCGPAAGGGIRQEDDHHRL